MTKLGWGMRACGVILMWAATAVALSPPAYNALASFNGAGNGNYPYAGLFLASDGNFYGTTTAGGAFNGGTVFQVPGPLYNTVAPIYQFCTLSACADGKAPYGGLVEVSGLLYGTTSSGGANGGGTVFNIPVGGGPLITMHNFAAYAGDGTLPIAGLVYDSATSLLYGTTANGGNALCGGPGCGTVFNISPFGVYPEATMHVFAGYTTEGSIPYAGLAFGASPNFLFGTTVGGGANANNAACAAYINYHVQGCGTVFRIKIVGPPALVTVYNFCSLANCNDGDSPYGALAVGAVANPFYGTTLLGGTDGAGTVFKITPAGALTVLHNFMVTDGDLPYDALVWSPTKKVFYATTSEGGSGGYGTVFKISPSGILATVHNFTGPTTDGSFSYSGLALGPTGNTFLYGTTFLGGVSFDGTTFRAQ